MKQASFSAEALKDHEPELLRQRVQRKLPHWAFLLVAYVILLIAVWWLVR